jgi:hypothetical protein
MCHLFLKIEDCITAVNWLFFFSFSVCLKYRDTLTALCPVENEAVLAVCVWRRRMKRNETKQCAEKL